MGIFSGNRPEWVIVGVQRSEGGVLLMASTKMTYAEIQTEYRRNRVRMDMDRSKLLMEDDDIFTTLTAGINDYTVVMADDYPTALLKLFGQWTPDQNEQHQLSAPAPELNEGDLDG